MADLKQETMTSEKTERGTGADLTLERSGVKVADVVELSATKEEERKTLLKIDRYLMPVMGICYMLQLLDKLSLSYATQLGIIEDLKLRGTDYSWCSSVFYFGYLGWSWPSSYLAVRFPLGKYIAITVIVWGSVLMLHAATSNFGGLMTVRFFLGMAEAAVAPGFSLITGMFYKRREQPLRHGIWFAGNCVANIIGGVIGYGIGHISSDLASWRVLFLILGGITAGYSIVLLLLLPDSPAKARFLTRSERSVALHRTLENKTGIMDEGKFRMDQMWDAFRDPQAWLLFLYTISVNIPNGGITSFASLIIAGFGFSRLTALLVQMPIGASQLIALGIISFGATYIRNCRLFLMTAVCLVSLLGMILIYALDHSNQYGRLIGIWLAATFASNIPISLSLIASNVGGFTKKATVTAMLFIAYCIGNIIGPQFYLAAEAPSYPTGFRSTIAGFCFAILFLVLMYTYYTVENRRRDRLHGSPSRLPVAEEIAEDGEGSNGACKGGDGGMFKVDRTLDAVKTCRPD